jgi:hypothetical protein
MGTNLKEAVLKTVRLLRGAYAIAVVAVDSPDEVVVARSGSPLVLGLGAGENFAASDIPALLHFTKDMIFLNDGELAVLRRDSVAIFDFDGHAITRAPTHITWDVVTAQKQGYKHFMLKEIHEQPHAVANTLQNRYELSTGRIVLPELGELSERIQTAQMVYLVAMGTAYYAALTAKYLWREFFKVPIAVELASEFRYSKPYLDRNTLVIAISQSGETGRYSGGGAAGAGARRGRAWDRQRRGGDADAGVRRHALHPRRPGDRRRLHQGVSRAAGRAQSLGVLCGTSAGLALIRADPQSPGEPRARPSPHRTALAAGEREIARLAQIFL